RMSTHFCEFGFTSVTVPAARALCSVNACAGPELHVHSSICVPLAVLAPRASRQDPVFTSVLKAKVPRLAPCSLCENGSLLPSALQPPARRKAPMAQKVVFMGSLAVRSDEERVAHIDGFPCVSRLMKSRSSHKKATASEEFSRPSRATRRHAHPQEHEDG